MSIQSVKITKNQLITQLFLGIIFSTVSFVVPNNYNMILPIMLFGCFFLYLFSPTSAFIYSFIFVIDPMATFKLSAISIIPILLCFIFFILNFNECLRIILKDKHLRSLMRICLLFTIYQVIVSLLLLSQQDFYYVFQNIRYWLGIWLLIPTYVFIVLDRKTFFISITLIVFIITMFYYLSFFNIYDFFEIREFKRNNESDSLIRFFSFDLRQITKIFVYIFPLFIIFPFKKPIVKLFVVLIGIMVYVSVVLAILRTEMFYLLMGSLLSILISINKFRKVNNLKIVVLGFVSVSFILYLFPNLSNIITQTVELSSKLGELKSDESASHRINVQLPVLMKILESNPFFGGGNYSVSYEATTHYLLYDIPVLGAFGAYGIIGMLIYYSRFIYIFTRYKSVKMTQKLFNQFPVECLLTNGLLAYFITMITFRTLHINMELAFDFGMAEFGLFIGVYFGLIKLLSEQKTN